VRIARSPAPAADGELPLWPPLLATRGPGGKSAPHAHHGLHLVLAVEGSLSVRTAGSKRAVLTRGVLTGPDVEHAIDARDVEVALVFIEPESSAGVALRTALAGSLRLLDAKECDALLRDLDPLRLMQHGGVEWTREAVRVLGGSTLAKKAPLHPKVRKLLRLLPALTTTDDTSLEALAGQVGLSSGRLMHAFSQSIGIPLRPYLAWLRLQRAAAAIANGTPLSEAAAHSGFADSAHMSRTFRRMLGIAPSSLRPART
jgi:AraC-like DNA-binding protein